MVLLRLWIRAPLVIACVLVTLLLMSAGGLLGARRFNRRIMCLSFLVGAWLFGLHVTTHGKLSPARPLLLVSNHFSYLDLFAIGSHIPASFTPKSEIASWPVIGMLCKMAGCRFIDRRTTKTMENKRALEQAREEGEIISLFPEGTTNEGHSILPFKSSFFSLAEQADITVQPLSIIYTHLNGKRVNADALPVIGWYGDALFFPHVVQFLKQRSAAVTLHFHPAVHGKDFASRKELALYCQKTVASAFAFGHSTV